MIRYNEGYPMTDHVALVFHFRTLIASILMIKVRDFTIANQAFPLGLPKCNAEYALRRTRLSFSTVVLAGAVGFVL